MKLTDYIEDIGVGKFAEMVGVSTTQVWKYQNLSEVPRPAVARKIKQITHGLVDYSDIYDPYFNHQHKDESQTSFLID
jgi:predicted transcriptional regulator